MMDDVLYSSRQFEVFSTDLRDAFLNSGFDIVDEPCVDHELYGFRATYIRRYSQHKPNIFYRHNEIPDTLIQVVGLPFGHNANKMVIISSPKNMNNEQISDNVKLRIQFDDTSYVVSGDINNQEQSTVYNVNVKENFDSSSKPIIILNRSIQKHNDTIVRNYKAINVFYKYIAHIIELISPGLILLPTEIKLEILKQLSVESVVKVSQVNNEFRSLIFSRGESLWRHLCLRDFNIKVINRAIHSSWMELYRETYIINQIDICRKERALPGLPERPALPPAPYRLQIEWLPEVMELPFYPIDDLRNGIERAPMIMPLDFFPLRRADSLDGFQ